LRKTALHLPIGTHFFKEIAKFRALRVAYAHLMKSLGETDAVAQSPFVIAQTAPYPASQHDPLNNLLKATTEAMSAVLGGSNGIAISAYNDSESARAARLGRNVQHLLRHESYLANVKDAAGGAYFIETLTNELAEKAMNSVGIASNR
jgi:methylmalonyl-CoA mutase